MSANAVEYEVVDLPPDPNSLRGRFVDPAVRNYLFVGLGALVMIFMVLLQQGSDIGGLGFLMVGTVGLIFRWPTVPPFLLLWLLWFLAFPFGLPPIYENPYELGNGTLRIADVLLAFSLVVYISVHYRLYGLTMQAVALEERALRGKKPKPTKRPASLIRSGEVARLIYLSVGVVLAGQFLWLLATSLEIDVNADFPIKWAKQRLTGQKRLPEELYLWHTRLLILLGIGFLGTLLARLVFGYWKLRILSAAEGGMMIQDAGWDETRREQTRVEKWRIWSKDRENAKANDDGQPNTRGKR